MADDKVITLGEFWVDSDGEIFIDIDNPLEILEVANRFQKIKELQKKLQKVKNSSIATRYSNRRPSE